MLKRPKILDIPDAISSLFGGYLACSGNTCASGYSCSEVDSSDDDDDGGCSYTLGVGSIAAGIGAGVTVGIALT
ncbi:hypothetical protein SH1V18_46450 [Vallitalea longa]|uniref:Bacteriocin n=1 Tax=Vallitalea longa TaxID=2936439 RepID=A0A9W5YGP2_9FIRM|nr:hypothetical protein [Vallitalea longa]GKX32165.1 hypothetical protein SH1V18_46450 [Vallitalea longa]